VEKIIPFPDFQLQRAKRNSLPTRKPEKSVELVTQSSRLIEVGWEVMNLVKIEWRRIWSLDIPYLVLSLDKSSLAKVQRT
jgi:hypothetical protein